MSKDVGAPRLRVKDFGALKNLEPVNVEEKRETATSDGKKRGPAIYDDCLSNAITTFLDISKSIITPPPPYR